MNRDADITKLECNVQLDFTGYGVDHTDAGHIRELGARDSKVERIGDRSTRNSINIGVNPENEDEKTY